MSTLSRLISRLYLSRLVFGSLEVHLLPTHPHRLVLAILELCFEPLDCIHHLLAPLCVGVNAAFEAIDGFVAAATGGGALLLEYFDPDASATFWTIPSGVRSLSDLAVI